MLYNHDADVERSVLVNAGTLKIFFLQADDPTRVMDSLVRVSLRFMRRWRSGACIFGTIWLLRVRIAGGVVDASTDRTAPECWEGKSKLKLVVDETVALDTRRCERAMEAGEAKRSAAPVK